MIALLDTFVVYTTTLSKIPPLPPGGLKDPMLNISRKRFDHV